MAGVREEAVMWSGLVPPFTPPANTGPPYWKCCDVVGAPGETECWACSVTTEPAAKGPVLHTSAAPVLVSAYPADPPVDRLTT